jgi:uncharacterized membrane protein
VNHFRSPLTYLQMMPAFLPWHQLLVQVSGAVEILGGLGLLFARTRLATGLTLIALLIAVFPANIHAAVHGMIVSGRPVPSWLLWARLPFQAALIWWVYIASWKGREAPR